MKRLLLLMSASLICFFACQKKQKDTLEPEPEEIRITPLTDSAFIQYIEVPGAENIVFDSTLDAYLITLQPGFTANEIGIEFKLYPGARLSWTNTVSNTLFNFAFKNKTPLKLQISTATQWVKTYEFFVKDSGPLKAAIDPEDELRLTNSGSLGVTYDLISGVGTIPESPGVEAKLTAALTDGTTGKQIAGSTWNNTIGFENAAQFKGSDQLGIVLKYGGKTFELTRQRKLLSVRSLIYSFGQFPLFSAAPLDKQIMISGTDFSAKARYKVTLQSDFLPNVVTVPATFGDSAMLRCTLPTSIPDGSYSISIFQNDTLVDAVVRTVARNEKEKAIGQVWVAQNDYFIDSPGYRRAKRVIAERGRAFYASPFPAVLGRMYSPFDPHQVLPDLQIKNAGTSITLKAVPKSDPSFADGSYNIYYGQYTLPADMPPGTYEVRLSYADKSVSMPFWDKIEVR